MAAAAARRAGGRARIAGARGVQHGVGRLTATELSDGLVWLLRVRLGPAQRVALATHVDALAGVAVRMGNVAGQTTLLRARAPCDNPLGDQLGELVARPLGELRMACAMAAAARRDAGVPYDLYRAAPRVARHGLAIRVAARIAKQ